MYILDIGTHIKIKSSVHSALQYENLYKNKLCRWKKGCIDGLVPGLWNDLYCFHGNLKHFHKGFDKEMLLQLCHCILHTYALTCSKAV